MIGKTCVIMVIGLLAFASADDQLNETFELEKQVFAFAPSKYEALEPSQFHQLLQRYEKDLLSRTDEPSRLQLEGIQQYLKAYEVEPGKCYEQMDLINYLKEVSMSFDMNLVPYLNFCKEKVIRGCKDKLAAETKKIMIQNLTLEGIKSLDELLEGIRGAGPEWEKRKLYLAAPIGGIQIALSKLLASDASPSPQKLSESINALFGCTCSTLVEGMVDIIAFYQTLLLRKDFSDLIDPLTMEWYSRAKVCKYLLDNPTIVASETFALLHPER